MLFGEGAHRAFARLVYRRLACGLDLSKMCYLLPQALPDAILAAMKNELSTGAPEEIRTPDPQIRRLAV
jgi:hypothetical protein